MMVDTHRQIDEGQASVGLLMFVRGSKKGLKQQTYGTMVIAECNCGLDMVIQAPGNTIEWFHRMYLVQLTTHRDHGGRMR